MQVNPEVIEKFAQVLIGGASGDQNIRRQAEQQLKQAEKSQGYSLLLLQVISQKKFDAVIRQSASIHLKNYVKANWEPNVKASRISDNEKDQVKKYIVEIMLSAPPSAQRQLSDSITTICEYDFPDKWKDLLPLLVSKLNTRDLEQVNGVLVTAHSIFKRYRDQELTEELIQEILFVLEVFAEPMLKLFQTLVSGIQSNKGNKSAMSAIFKCIVLLLKMFYSLNWQDLADFFADHMKEFMSIFHLILTVPNAILDVEDEEDQPDLITQSHTLVCQSVNLYMEKHEEEFGPFADQFAKDVWSLITKVTSGGKLLPKYDKLAAKAMLFLTTISKGVKHKLFSETSTIQNIIENIIIPNVTMRENDEDQFESDPVEYIRRDIEGSDTDTRRRSAIELLRALGTHNEKVVTSIATQKIEQLLSQDWKKKDVAIYLFLGISIKTSTQKKGAKEINAGTNVIDFFQKQILPELKSQNIADEPVLKADAIKFCTLYRSLFPKQTFQAILPYLVYFLSSPYRVVHTYAAWCIDNYLSVTEANGSPRYTKDDIIPVAQKLFENLFKALSMETSKENEYIMRALVRITSVLKDNMTPVLKAYLDGLKNILSEKCKNPTNPEFNHYMFEGFATVIRYNPKQAPNFENALYPSFSYVIEKDVQEFTPYVFQIMSQILEIRTEAVPDVYSQLFPKLLVPTLWENTGNVPGLTSFISTYMRKAPELVTRNIEPVLGIFQKLVMSKTLDHDGFLILDSIVEYISLNHYQKYLPQILTILFTRLQKKRTGKFTRCLILFFSLFIVRNGATPLIQLFDAMQNTLFPMISTIWFQEVNKIQGKYEKKLCAVAMIKIICETPIVLEKHSSMWGKYLLELLKFFELPEPKTEEGTNEVLSFDEEEKGYKVAYTRLKFASQPQHDKTTGVSDAKLYLVQSLNSLLSKPGYASNLIPLIHQQLKGGEFQCLVSYFNKANVNPSILQQK